MSVFVGAIGEYGTAVNVDKNGKVNPNGNFVKVKLKKGTFEIDSTALNKEINYVLRRSKATQPVRQRSRAAVR
jgi:hypothetical protein